MHRVPVGIILFLALVVFLQIAVQRVTMTFSTFIWIHHSLYRRLAFCLCPSSRCACGASNVLFDCTLGSGARDHPRYNWNGCQPSATRINHPLECSRSGIHGSQCTFRHDHASILHFPARKCRPHMARNAFWRHLDGNQPWCSNDGIWRRILS